MKIVVRKISFLLLCMLSLAASAQSRPKYATISGVVSIAQTKEPLGYAVIQLSPAEIYTSTEKDGSFRFDRVSTGKVAIVVKYVGMETQTKEITVEAGKNYTVRFDMKDVSFRMDDITVVATKSNAGEATSSTISRQAMDHLQTSSLKDIMSLLPGVSISNPTLNSAQNITLRTNGGSGNSYAMNSLGTAVIVDGAPISNNANLQVLSPTITTDNIDAIGGASPNSGVDIRTISTDNIESVEIIRGIPSVEYGDMTSGTVIVKSKAGVTPLVVRFKTNPNIYQVSASRGLSMGKAGDFNLSADYAYNINSLTASYQYYQRMNVKGLWTKNFGGKVSTNTSIELNYGKDTRDYNPDDEMTEIASGATSMGTRLSSYGNININRGWFKSIRYNISGSYTDRHSFYEETVSNAMSLYSTAMGNSTITNNRGADYRDSDGNVITHFDEGDEQAYATVMPYSYFTHYDIYGKEVNAYAKVLANFFARFGENISNRIIVGADFKTDGNLGQGVTFKEGTPPYRSITNASSGFRQRAYYDIPFINQLGLFAEDNWQQQIGERLFILSAGVRYDWVNELTSLTPRINASFEILPEILTLRGGWGITAKAPTAIYLYPQNAYYDYINYNNMRTGLSASEELVVATTTVFDATNPDLEMAKNRKAEIGFDLKIADRYRFSVTAYDEYMGNGYNIGTDISSWKYLPVTQYKVQSQVAGEQPVLEVSNVSNVFFQVNRPLNNTVVTNRGLEYEIDLGRFEQIRTSFYLNGAWSSTKASNKGYSFGTNSNVGTSEKNIAIYEPYLTTSCDENLLTTMRATHHLPSLGFVITLTGQVSWFEKSWCEYRDDEMFIKYISRLDGNVYDFNPEWKDDPEYAYMFTTRSSNRFAVELTQPYVLFNLNLTKEIGEFLTASFYVNNIFNSRPLYESKETPGSFSRLGVPMFFGFEVKVMIK